MNSISLSPSLQPFSQKHATKSRSPSPCTLSISRNIVVPKLYQCSTSKRKMHSKAPVVAALEGTNYDAFQQNNDVPSSPLLDLVSKFYAHLNGKDVRRLEKLFDPACVIEDETYYTPLEGKNIHKHFEKLTKAMGQHVVFSVDRICAGAESTIVALWHLEWNGEVIPFTRGCSFYTCSKNNGIYLIRRAYVFVEAPLKPRDSALAVFKIIISLFDRFPKLATGFLRRRDAIVFFILQLKVYNIVMFPVVIYYTRMFTNSPMLLTKVLTILNIILKFFF